MKFWKPNSGNEVLETSGTRDVHLETVNRSSLDGLLIHFTVSATGLLQCPLLPFYCVRYWPSRVSATGLLLCPLLAFYSVRYWPSTVSATGLLECPLLAFCCIRCWPSAVSATGLLLSATALLLNLLSEISAVRTLLLRT